MNHVFDTGARPALGSTLVLIAATLGASGCLFGLEHESPGGESSPSDASVADADGRVDDATDGADGGDAGGGPEGWSVRGTVVPGGGGSSGDSRRLEGRVVPGPAGPAMDDDDQTWQVRGEPIQSRQRVNRSN